MQPIVERILALYEEEKAKRGGKLSKADFAEEIGMTRQAFATLLSQNTNPSYQVLQGIYKKYPHLQLDWYFL